MKFDQVYNDFMTALTEDVDDSKREILDTKNIDLIIGDTEISLISVKDLFRIEVKYLDDAKFSGYVEYDREEDAKRTFEGLNTVGELLNFINVHAETDATIYPALKILKKELISIKRDMSEDEISELGLEFPL